MTDHVKLTDNYDPETHVTAGELRELYRWDLGTIPDCAHIRRGAWRVVGYKIDYEESSRKVNMGFDVVFIEPFRWIEGTFIVEKRVNDEDGNVNGSASTQGETRK
jgi:hypothetical protein